MRLLFKKSLYLFLLIMLTVACSQEETSYIVELCTVKGQGSQSLYLLSDAGKVLHPSASLDTALFKDGQRFRVTYVRMSGNAFPKDESVIEIKNRLPVLVKDAAGLDVDPKVIEGWNLNDPLWLLGEPWIGGGYLNFEFTYESSGNLDPKHSIQLLLDSVVRSKVYMTLGHNANGDSSQKEVAALASFPLSSINGIQKGDSLIVRVLEGTQKRRYSIRSL